ncbi:MAG: cation-translocating P-type ATPase [Lachnospiraceae bacterium]|jgi:heavy metal translocating P-type ATPase|nr:cation-translocating P-type ATPase [Lachnospiraceae bacterium]
MGCKECENDLNTDVTNKNILRKIFIWSSGILPTAIGGVFLTISLVVIVILKIEIPLDPAWVAIGLCGYPLLYLAIWRLLFRKGIHRISSSLLISIAMIAAIFIGELFAAGQVAFIMAIGGILEERTIARAKRGIKNLFSFIPKQAHIIRDSMLVEVDVTEVVVGDILRILPGETVPVDGEIISGTTAVDQVIITGESLPIDMTVGGIVYGGTLNLHGTIAIRATKVGEDSSLQKLLRLVEEAEENKAPTQQIIDKWAVWLVPLTLLLAIGTYLITGDIYRAVTVAIVFCPCALALATPTAVMAAIGQAATSGVIIKSGVALERMGHIDLLAFDKTGTITHGKLKVSEVISFTADFSEDYVLQLTAAAESYSEHPLAKAILAAVKEKSDTLKLPSSFAVTDFHMIPGKGISAKVDELTVYCGNRRWLAENGVVFDSVMEAAFSRLSNEGKAVVMVACGNPTLSCIGVVALSDVLRTETGGVVNELKELHADIVLLSGDNRQSAEYFAREAGFPVVHAELLPHQKVEHIRSLQNKGKIVGMVGDGVNDAPALKTADVGIAMASMGSDMAIEAADIALMGDDITKIPYLKRLSNATIRRITTNIMIAIVFNLVAITLSMLGFLNPVTGALAHNVGSVAVVLNAAMLYEKKFEK